MTSLNIQPEVQKILDSYGFNEIPFDYLRNRLKQDGFNPDASRTTAQIKPLSKGAMSMYPSGDIIQKTDLRQKGQMAIDAGETAVVILNGGMATRFGGVPKGAVPVVDNRSFLDFKLSQIKKAGAGKTPALLMNSFATQEATSGHIKTLNLDMEILDFHQFVSLRMTETGDIFTSDDGRPSTYAPGHGDFPYALKASGQLAKLKKRGVKYIVLSNVDNLGASLDPVIIGMHIDGGNPVSVELVAANKGDVGGFSAIENGKDVIMEAFRLPADFNTDDITVFNTNTFVFNLDALENTKDLSWFMVQKNVNGKKAVQCERLVGQMTEFVDVSWLVVPRTGSESRFIPIKTVQDITDRQNDLRAALQYQGVL